LFREALEEKRRAIDEVRLADEECRRKGFEITFGIFSAVALPAAVPLLLSLFAGAVV